MKNRQKQVIEALQRVQDFLALYPPINPAPKFAETRGALDASVKRILELTGDEYVGQRSKRDSTREQEKLRKTLLKEHLTPISRIAKAILPSDPTIQKALAMPKQQLGSTRLATVGSAMRKAAAPYESMFVDADRPADFLARLDGAIAALRGSLVGRARNVGLHVGARKGLVQELRSARKSVQMLDAMVEDAFLGNAEVLARWRVAKRIQELPTAPRATGGTADENLPASREAGGGSREAGGGSREAGGGSREAGGGSLEQKPAA
jgi:hypothetical protein